MAKPQPQIKLTVCNACDALLSGAVAITVSPRRLTRTLQAARTPSNVKSRDVARGLRGAWCGGGGLAAWARATLQLSKPRTMHHKNKSSKGIKRQ